MHAATDSKRFQVTAWALWDWGSAAFNAVLITFIFSVYLVESVGSDVGGPLSASQYYSFAIGLAGISIAAITPIMGRRSDLRGTRRRAVGVWTFVTVGLMAALFVVRNDAPSYFWIGITVLALASITFEIAEVNYFAQLRQISTPDNVGRISGYGWAMGYFGGIFLLLICYYGFVAGEGGIFGLPTEGGMNIRLVALFAAAWFGLSAIPVLLRVPEIPPSGQAPTSIGESYRQLFRDIVHLWRSDRNAALFLIASAIFRDGLAGVFTFGALIAVTVYGLSPGDVLIFGVVANVAAAAGSMVGGLFDDRFGPKSVILTCLALMLCSAAALMFVQGPTGFWIFGLALCLFVGPAQSAARSFLTRVCPDGRDGQMFGLYAMTGRAVSWLAPLMFGMFVFLGNGSDRPGILGIALVLLVGAVVLLVVKDPSKEQKDQKEQAAPARV